MNDNILNDIEKDISGDWNNIQKKLKNKIKFLSHNGRMNLPDYNEFIYILKEVLINYDNKEKVISMIRDLLSYQGIEKSPKSFNNIWKMFCCPDIYDIKYDVKCNKCYRKYDIIYKRSKRNNISYDSLFEQRDLSYESVFCINCGNKFFNVFGEDIIGVCVSDKDDIHERKKRYKYFVNEFRNNYQNDMRGGVWS